MHVVTDPVEDQTLNGSGEESKPQVRTLLLTDLCDSTMLVEKLGDAAAAELFREHDRLVLGLQQRWHGRLIDRSDGLMLLFERAIDGLGFALDYARGLREIGERRKVSRHGVELRARSGLHVGEVLMWRNSDAAVSFGAKPLEVEGLAKPMAGRLMTLARPGQILLSATAEPLAHRAARELGERGEQLVWKSWGRWRFKGVPQAQDVYEVGEADIAPLRAPQQIRGKAWRDIPLWRRPAALAAELLLVAGIAGGGWFLTRPQPAIAFGERDWVVVADLRNLTGDTLLDESLDQAFRISLEQSRYVNVLSDLKARDTLQRMRRSEDTVLDRAIASEIALRDGARAVILPTVAEVGGRVRVSAEVIDPHTQTTVYAESADGSGAVSTLRSFDKVTAALRGRLGEAMDAIQKNSVTLPNVTTSNLDALKAYAVGMSLGAKGERVRALPYFSRAVALDPDFALAHMRIGNLQVVFGNLPGARAAYERASALRDHLPGREAALLEANRADHGPPAIAKQRWQEVLALYPDTHDAQFQLAQTAMFYLNEYAESLPFAKAAQVSQSSRAGVSSYLEGILLLGMDRPDEAIATFERSRRMGFNGDGVLYAYAHAAKRDFAQASKILGMRKPTGTAADLEPIQGAALIALDQGHAAEARKLVAQGLAQAVALDSPLAEAEWRSYHLAMEAAAHGSGEGLEAKVLAEITKLSRDRKKLDAIYPNLGANLLLANGYIAARLGSAKGVHAVLAEVSPSSLEGYPVLQQSRLVLEAEQARQSGDAARSIELLVPLVASDHTIMPVHWALMKAAEGSGNDALADEQAGWLARHRGRAYTEEGTDRVVMPFNIADTTRPRR